MCLEQSVNEEELTCHNSLLDDQETHRDSRRVRHCSRGSSIYHPVDWNQMWKAWYLNSGHCKEDALSRDYLVPQKILMSLTKSYGKSIRQINPKILMIWSRPIWFPCLGFMYEILTGFPKKARLEIRQWDQDMRFKAHFPWNRSCSRFRSRLTWFPCLVFLGRTFDLVPKNERVQKYAETRAWDWCKAHFPWNRSCSWLRSRPTWSLLREYEKKIGLTPRLSNVQN